MSDPEEDAISANRRRATVSYVLALVITAVVSLAGYAEVDRLVRQQAESAETLGLQNQQAVLTEVITRTALGLSLGATGPQRDALQNAIVMMRTTTGNDATATRQVNDLLAHADAVLAATALPGSLPPSGDLAALVDSPLPGILASAIASSLRSAEDATRSVRTGLAVTAGLILLTLVLEAAYLFRPLFRRLEITQQTLLEATRTDPLTGCLNRRSFLVVAEQEFSRAQRHNVAVALIMIDIDHLRQINETGGHAAGDQMIRTLVSTMVGAIRTTDTLGRLGGEEFALILPETSLAQAAIVAGKLCATIAGLSVAAAGGSPRSMTISLGVTAVDDKDPDVYLTLGRADRAMYRAKHNGCNGVVSLGRQDEEDERIDDDLEA